MGTTFAQLQTRVFVFSGLDETGDLTTVKQLINEACRDVWFAHPWPERFTEAFFNTVLPYTTGTATFTNASTTLTGSGTTWATFSAGAKKVALSYGDPSYVAATRDSNTQLTLARAYVGATAADSSYVLYADEYDLAATVDQIVGDGLRLHADRPSGTLDYIPPERLDRTEYMPGVTGRPEAWTLVPDYTAGTRRVRLYPIPDAVYAVSYLYRKAFTELSADADEPVIAEVRRDLIWKRALVDAAMLAGKPTIAAWARGEYEAGLARAKAVERAVDPTPLRFRRFDEPSRENTVYLDVTD